MASSSGNDDDLTIPRAAINKMIKETLPNVRVANDARELVVNCCTEFIHLVSSEANEICNKSEKKTISPEHVIQALESLGFGSYISEVKEVLQECKTVALKRRKASSRLENLGIPEEELLRQQQELFAKVTEIMKSETTYGETTVLFQVHLLCYLKSSLDSTTIRG
ncbi:protein Dr1 isoform X2 [Mastomys coucha]|uniref:protein Dr1 isoform X2 n=1 Tax=Mastomys coucha TaxID=35658 RepID=UPI0012629958|nr:protein Dr1 isoform X2 [Mastomys coucha]